MTQTIRASFTTVPGLPHERLSVRSKLSGYYYYAWRFGVAEVISVGTNYETGEALLAAAEICVEGGRADYETCRKRAADYAVQQGLTLTGEERFQDHS